MQVDRLEKLLEFLKNEPDDEFLLYALATEYLRLNQADTALSYYERWWPIIPAIPALIII
jgi:predicted Zn-dependent protease